MTQLDDTVVLDPNVNPADVERALIDAVNLGWRQGGNDGRCNTPANFVGPTGYTWFEAHYVALDDTGQLILPSGDDFSDWGYDDFEVWAPAPRLPRADGVREDDKNG